MYKTLEIFIFLHKTFFPQKHYCMLFSYQSTYKLREHSENYVMVQDTNVTAKV